MNYTTKYAHGLLKMIHDHEKIIKEKYDGELYIHIQNMRSELRMINDLETPKLWVSKFKNIEGKFIKADWKPKKTYIPCTSTPHYNQ